MGNLVGKFVGLCLVEGLVGSSVGIGGGGEKFDLCLGWVDVVGIEVDIDSSCEFFFIDLSVTVDVNLIEVFVGMSFIDTLSWVGGGDFDGGGGGDKGEDEFHFEGCFFYLLL